MVKTVELKPPQDIVEAIQQSEDGSTAPPEAEVLGTTGATREIATKLMHETPQKPSDLPDELRQGNSHGNPMTDPNMSHEDKHLKEMEIRQEQNHPQNYDRSHPGAGKAGRGDQSIDSMQGVSRFAKE
eukprot:GHUV01001277.1.p1 GENE.GHUV01001277.1~~GHUV01001277.1.p1  ORF type:complete len:128 (+),score=48.02 GHUV01001277.1:154-537(+)